jgi:hypothetical protein
MCKSKLFSINNKYEVVVSVVLVELIFKALIWIDSSWWVHATDNGNPMQKMIASNVTKHLSMLDLVSNDVDESKTFFGYD